MSDDAQINVTDLMDAFAAESAQLLKRVVIAEQRAKAMQTYIATLRQQPPPSQVQVVEDPEAYRRGLEDGWNACNGGVPYEEAVGDKPRTADPEPPATKTRPTRARGRSRA